MNTFRHLAIAASLIVLGLAPISGALAINAGSTSPASVNVIDAKDYNVRGGLRIGGNVGYAISGANGTVTTTVGSVTNDNPDITSGPIRLRVIATSLPINGSFTYYTVGEVSLDPLPPLYAYNNFAVTAPLVTPPDGLYYLYVAVFEQEPGCGAADGFCLDDYVSFANRLRVTGGAVSTQGADPASANAVEYYHAQFDHYFFTAIPDEIAKLDSGYFAGWSRTGRSFGVWSYDVGGTAPVCRFFSTSFAPKSSHFYTPFPSECAIVKGNPDWQYEGIVAYVDLPFGDGSCATGSPLYRLYNDGMGGAPNHRYTTSTAVRADMIANGWIPEGYGAAGVIACVPY